VAPSPEDQDVSQKRRLSACISESFREILRPQEADFDSITTTAPDARYTVFAQRRRSGERSQSCGL
jgi:hypothetical protein